MVGRVDVSQEEVEGGAIFAHAHEHASGGVALRWLARVAPLLVSLEYDDV